MSGLVGLRIAVAAGAGNVAAGVDAKKRPHGRVVWGALYSDGKHANMAGGF
jgi:hypothetical protein